MTRMFFLTTNNNKQMFITTTNDKPTTTNNKKQVFERADLEKWVEKKKCHPVSMKSAFLDEIQECREMRDLCADYAKMKSCYKLVRRIDKL